MIQSINFIISKYAIIPSIINELFRKKRRIIIIIFLLNLKRIFRGSFALNEILSKQCRAFLSSRRFILAKFIHYYTHTPLHSLQRNQNLKITTNSCSGLKVVKVWGIMRRGDRGVENELLVPSFSIRTRRLFLFHTDSTTHTLNALNSNFETISIFIFHQMSFISKIHNKLLIAGFNRFCAARSIRMKLEQQQQQQQTLREISTK